MSEFKNLKVSERTHKALVLRANSLGMKVYALADALLSQGLKMGATAINKAVAETQQLRPPEPDTSQEQPQQRETPLASSDESP
jgi:hypothetical protein